MKNVPAIKATMGSTTYYETVVTAQELAGTVRPVKKSDRWVANDGSNDIEEVIQRALVDKRVEQEIAPYLAEHQDRFFGSIIILTEPGGIEFEPLSDVVKDLPRAYQQSVSSMGFLSTNGELIALDGQHRLAALGEVVHGRVEGPFQQQVNRDEISVIVIEFEDLKKTRTIFSKVNRHAKNTGRANDIAISEDDGFAVVARRLQSAGRSDAPLAPRTIDGDDRVTVNIRSNTIAKRAWAITTLSTVYETVKVILQDDFPSWSPKKPVCPPDDQLDAGYKKAAAWWNAILAGSKPLADAMAAESTDEIDRVRFDTHDPACLLLRPIGQLVLVMGIKRAMAWSNGALTLEEAIRRSNGIDWSSSAGSQWTGLIAKPDGSVSVRKDGTDLAATLLAYLIGAEFMTSDMITNLETAWNEKRSGLSAGEALPVPADGQRRRN